MGKHSLNLFFIRFFSTVAAFLVVYHYSHTLSTAEYGSYQSIWTSVAFINAFAGLGISSIVFTYTPQKLLQILNGLPRNLKTGIIAIPLLCGVVFAAHSFLQGYHAVLFFAFFLLYNACAVLEVLLSALHRFRLLPAISFVYAALFCVLHYYAACGSLDMNVLFGWLALLLLVRLILYLFIFLPIDKSIEAADTGAVNIAEVKLLWKHLYFFEASQILIAYLDKFILSNMLSKADFALYFNATMSIPFISLVFSAIANAGMMQLAKTRETASQVSVLHHTGKLLSTVAFPCFFFFVFFSREVFTVLFSEKYLSAIPIFICAMLSLPVRAYSYTAILQTHHKGQIINKGVVMDLAVSVLLIFPLYHLLGLKGVVLSFVIGTYVQAIYYLVCSGRLLQVPFYRLIPLKNWSVKFILFGISIFSLHYFLKNTLQDAALLITGLAATSGVSLILLLREFKMNSLM